MNGRVCKRLRMAVYGPKGDENRQHFVIQPTPHKRLVCIGDDQRRRYQAFKRAYCSFPWHERHTAFTVRKSV